MAGAGTFSLCRWVPNSSRTHMTCYPMVTEIFSVEVMWVWESVYSPPSSSKVRNAWIFTLTPPTCFHGMVFEHRGVTLSFIILKYICNCNVNIWDKLINAKNTNFSIMNKSGEEKKVAWWYKDNITKPEITKTVLTVCIWQDCEDHNTKLKSYRL